MPDDDPEALLRRLKVDYPIDFDRALGRRHDPHHSGSSARSAVRARSGRSSTACRRSTGAGSSSPTGRSPTCSCATARLYPRSAVLMSACFDLGCVVYWAVPTAPPWWAGENGNMPPVRRIMAEAGERFWGRLWRPLYHSLQGNPFAAMPSLHFGTSVMAARLLSQVGPGHAAAGWTYALVARVRARLSRGALRHGSAGRLRSRRGHLARCAAPRSGARRRSPARFSDWSRGRADGGGPAPPPRGTPPARGRGPPPRRGVRIRRHDRRRARRGRGGRPPPSATERPPQARHRAPCSIVLIVVAIYVLLPNLDRRGRGGRQARRGVSGTGSSSRSASTCSPSSPTWRCSAACSAARTTTSSTAA